MISNIISYCTNHKDKIINIIKYIVVDIIIMAIICGVIISCTTDKITNYIEKHSEKYQQLKDLSSVYIGSSKDWIDQQFGYPQFSGMKSDNILCAYVSDFFILQVVFDSTESVQAYLITLLENNKVQYIEVIDNTLVEHNNIRIGKFSYYDFLAIPDYVYGFVSNGNARALYLEKYNFMSTGNYYDYYIATFDYGKLNSTVNKFIQSFSIPNKDIDDEVKLSHNIGTKVITDRKNNCPNTYGVSKKDIDLLDLLFNYDWYNSQQIRNNLNNIT